MIRTVTSTVEFTCGGCGKAIRYETGGHSGQSPTADWLNVELVNGCMGIAVKDHLCDECVEKCPPLKKLFNEGLDRMGYVPRAQGKST